MSATMISLSRKLVTESELRRLRTDSFEEKITAVAEAVQRAIPDYFKPGTVLEVVASASVHAIVAAEGDFFKVSLKESDAGMLYPIGVEALVVEAYSTEDLPQYARKLAKESVAAFLQGSQAQALESVQALIALPIDSIDVPSVVEALSAELHKDATWKTALQERSKEMKRLIRQNLGSVAEAGDAKYRPLYGGTMTEADISGYDDLVQRDLDAVLAKVTSLWEDTAEAQSVAGKSIDTDTDERSILSVFENFAGCLVDDLQSLQARCAMVNLEIDDTPTRARIRDEIAENLRPYEVGSQFVVAVAHSLEEEAR
jgi:hypothetical protein